MTLGTEFTLSLKELKQECVEAEKKFSRKEPKNFSSMPVNRFTRKVNEVFENPAESFDESPNPYEEMAALQVDNRQQQQAVRKQIIFWNCRQNGYMFMDCQSTERTLFCYRCGKPDVKFPNCTNCKAKNLHRGEIVAGNHRCMENLPAGRL